MLLTNQEAQVIRLAIQGLTNAEIAKALQISKNTVKSYKARVHRKLKPLGIANKDELTKYKVILELSDTSKDYLIL